MKYYLIQYSLTHNEGNGYAIVTACNPKDAANILTRQGKAVAKGYQVQWVEEFTPTEDILKCCELNSIIAEGLLTQGDKGDTGVGIEKVWIKQGVGSSVAQLYIRYTDKHTDVCNFTIPSSVVQSYEAKYQAFLANLGNNYTVIDTETDINKAIHPGIYKDCNGWKVLVELNYDPENEVYQIQQTAYKDYTDCKYRIITYDPQWTKEEETDFSDSPSLKTLLERVLNCIDQQEQSDQEEQPETSNDTNDVTSTESENNEETVTEEPANHGSITSITDWEQLLNSPFVYVTEGLDAQGVPNIDIDTANLNKIYITASIDTTDNNEKTEWIVLEREVEVTTPQEDSSNESNASNESNTPEEEQPSTITQRVWEKIGGGDFPKYGEEDVAGFTIGGLQSGESLAGKDIKWVIDQIIFPDFLPVFHDASVSLSCTTRSSGSVSSIFNQSVPTLSDCTATVSRAYAIAGSNVAYGGEANGDIYKTETAETYTYGNDSVRKITQVTFTCNKTFAAGSGDGNKVLTTRGNSTKWTSTSAGNIIYTGEDTTYGGASQNNTIKVGDFYYIKSLTRSATSITYYYRWPVFVVDADNQLSKDSENQEVYLTTDGILTDKNNAISSVNRVHTKGTSPLKIYIPSHYNIKTFQYYDTVQQKWFSDIEKLSPSSNTINVGNTVLYSEYVYTEDTKGNRPYKLSIQKQQ